MSEILSIIVLLALLVGLFKMFGRYMATAILFGIFGAIIGAIFTDGLWGKFAVGGMILGFVLNFFIYSQEAWLTFLGALVGALIGAGIAYFIPDSAASWGFNIFLGLILAGGALGSSQAAEDLFEQTPHTIRDPKEAADEVYRDARGEFRHGVPKGTCGDCWFFQRTEENTDHCSIYNSIAHSYDYACESYG